MSRLWGPIHWSGIFLFLFAAYLYPSLLHVQRVLLHDRAFTQDAPAATEILIGLGLGDRLVAVSNYDQPRQAIKNLPRVGDYQTTDWERLATLRPTIMITQFGPNRLPQGMVQKAEQLNIRIVNVSITRLDDIFQAMKTLASAVEEPDRGDAAIAALREKFDAVVSRTTGPKVRTLIVTSAEARGVAGRKNFLDDILTIAGGENVISPGAPYPTIDREMLIELDPETFHVTAHYKDYSMVLARIASIEPEQLRSFLTRQWRKNAPKTFLKKHDAETMALASAEPGAASIIS